jgi:hypothetical protein
VHLKGLDRSAALIFSHFASAERWHGSCIIETERFRMNVWSASLFGFNVLTTMVNYPPEPSRMQACAM